MNITTPPCTPIDGGGGGGVLKRSKRACKVRAYLGWKHHEAPWGEYYNSTHHPYLDAKLVHDHSIAQQNVAI